MAEHDRTMDRREVLKLLLGGLFGAGLFLEGCARATPTPRYPTPVAPPSTPTPGITPARTPTPVETPVPVRSATPPPQTPTQTVTPSSTPTPHPTPTSTLTLTATKIKQKFLDPLYVYSTGSIDNYHSLVEDLQIVPDWLISKNLEKIKEQFPFYKDNLLNKINNYWKVRDELRVFEPSLSRIADGKTPREETIFAALENLEKEIKTSIKYDDPKIITDSSINQLKKTLEEEFAYVSIDEFDKFALVMDYFSQFSSDALSYGGYYSHYWREDPATLTIVYKFNGRVGQFSGECYRDSSEGICEIGWTLYQGSSAIPPPNVPLEIESQSLNFAKFNFRKKYSDSSLFSFFIYEIDAERHIDNILTNSLKIDEKSEELSGYKLRRVFWKGEKGNYYSYVTAVGRYILLIDPTETFWDNHSKYYIEKFLDYLQH